MSLSHRLASFHFPHAVERWCSPNTRRQGVTVLMYHEVLPDQCDCPSWLVVRQSEFEQQMLHLQAHYTVVSIDDLAGSAVVHDPKRPAVAITFDDGYAGNALYAAPILRELKLPFTVYVATACVANGGRYWYDDIICSLLVASKPIEVSTSRGKLLYLPIFGPSEEVRWSPINTFLSEIKLLSEDERIRIAAELSGGHLLPELRMMTPQEVKTLASDPNATIGNHTNGHELLDQVSLDVAARSVKQAQVLLTSWTGRAPRHFAYPNGNSTEEHRDLLAQFGFASAMTTQPGVWTPSSSPFEIPRIGVGRFDNLNLFRAKLSGLVS